MSKRLLRWAARVESFVDQVWYLPLLAVVAAADLFLVVIPTDGFLVTTTMLRPKKWISAALWLSLGSATGSMAFAALFQALGHEVFGDWVANAATDGGWTRSTRFVTDYGAVALGLVALGPIPINVGVFAASVLEMKPAAVFAAVLSGRIFRNLFLAWAATHAPRYLRGARGVKAEVKAIQEAGKDLSAS
ncbi:MAG: hypothetical protein NDJ90_16015 [Oligoflexia bacterium]|nr:hypothetical protein [Oligoflexia bacterium]